MRSFLAVIAAALIAVPAVAEAPEMSTGPVISDYGPVLPVENYTPIDPQSVFKVSFDVAKGAEEGKVNQTLESAARFLNMHGRAGVDPQNVSLAVVVHGRAVFDVAKPQQEGAENVSAPLVKALQERGVRIIVCGQSASYQGLAKEDLLPGVELALSAMTAHAQLQSAGFALNPF
ncbi:MAG: DsrE family protein [Pseudomonadota bacterium]